MKSSSSLCSKSAESASLQALSISVITKVCELLITKTNLIFLICRLCFFCCVSLICSLYPTIKMTFPMSDPKTAKILIEDDEPEEVEKSAREIEDEKQAMKDAQQKIVSGFIGRGKPTVSG